MRRPYRLASAPARTGFAMVAVLLVLMALFVLCAPFLMTLRNADKASAEVADRSTLRVTLDAADRHARARLSASSRPCRASRASSRAERSAARISAASRPTSTKRATTARPKSEYRAAPGSARLVAEARGWRAERGRRPSDSFSPASTGLLSSRR